MDRSELPCKAASRKVRVVIALRKARWKGFAEEEACVVKCAFKRGGVMAQPMRFYNVLKIARPDSICWESRVFCLCWKGMSRLLGLRVRDSKDFSR